MKLSRPTIFAMHKVELVKAIHMKAQGLHPVPAPQYDLHHAQYGNTYLLLLTPYKQILLVTLGIHTTSIFNQEIRHTSIEMNQQRT